jgi:hypothetical protein
MISDTSDMEVSISSNHITLNQVMSLRLIREGIKTCLNLEKFGEACSLIGDYIMIVRKVVQTLRAIILEKFPLPVAKDSPKSPALLEVKNDPNGSSRHMIKFYLNGEQFYLLPFSTGTAPLSCLDNFPTEIEFMGHKVKCTFEFEGNTTNSEAVFAAEKIKDEILEVEVLREKFGDLPIFQNVGTMSTRHLVLSLDKMDAKLAPRKLTSKDGFFGPDKLWDKEVRIWAMIKALLPKFQQNLPLRAMLSVVCESKIPLLIQEIQSNTDPWTALATDDSVGLLGACLEITHILLECNTTFEDICPPPVLELMK